MICANGVLLYITFSEAGKFYSGTGVLMFDSISNEKPLSLAK
jgi:hypothetical protein